MKRIAALFKPLRRVFRRRPLAYLILLLAQAVGLLCPPALLGGIVDAGSQGGVEIGLPEAFSGRGMDLLQFFMTEEEQERINGLYNTLEPGSSESQRLSEKYPLARQETICVLRDDAQGPDRAEGLAIFDAAAYAAVLYAEHAQKTGELEKATGQLVGNDSSSGTEFPKEYGENLQLPGEKAENLPEGVLGSIPEDALFTMPEGTPSPEGSAVREESSPSSQPDGDTRNLVDFEGKDFGAGQGSEAGPEEAGQDAGQETGPAAETEGGPKTDLESLYAMLPLLSRVPQEGLKEAAEASRRSASGEREQAGLALKRMVYRELGINVDGMRSGLVWRESLLLAGTFLFSAAAGAAAVWLLSWRKPVRAFSLGCGFLLDGVGGLALALKSGPSLGWTVAAGVLPALGLALALLAGKGIFPRTPPPSRVGRRLLRILPLALPALEFAMAFFCLIILWIAGDGVRQAGWPAGAAMASSQYAVLAAVSWLAGAALFRLGPKRRGPGNETGGEGIS